MEASPKKSYRIRQSSFRSVTIGFVVGAAVLLAAAGPGADAAASPLPVVAAWSTPLLPGRERPAPPLPECQLPSRRLPIRPGPIVHLIPLADAEPRPVAPTLVDWTVAQAERSVPWVRYGRPLDSEELAQYEGGMGPMGVGMLVGAVGGAASYGVEACLSGEWRWSDFGSSVFSGAAAGLTMGAAAGGGKWLDLARGVAGAVVKKVADWAWPF
ncbi:MAG: hypothetical protein IMX01_07960 [Limnochordaceae bacterium]|nr:hypothetical protein [Limnochordaceae bacterium]